MEPRRFRLRTLADFPIDPVRLIPGAAPAPHRGGGEKERLRRTRLPAGQPAAEALAACQRAMAAEGEWLAVAVERSLSAAWLTRTAPGQDVIYRLTVVDRDERPELLERLHSRPAPPTP